MGVAHDRTSVPGSRDETSIRQRRQGVFEEFFSTEKPRSRPRFRAVPHCERGGELKVRESREQAARRGFHAVATLDVVTLQRDGRRDHCATSG